jgi:hypothetical protein
LISFKLAQLNLGTKPLGLEVGKILGNDLLVTMVSPHWNLSVPVRYIAVPSFGWLQRLSEQYGYSRVFLVSLVDALSVVVPLLVKTDAVVAWFLMFFWRFS